MRGDLDNKGTRERQLTEQLQSYERQLAEKISAAEQLQKQYDELRSQFDSTQQDKDKKKLVSHNIVYQCICISRTTVEPVY